MSKILILSNGHGEDLSGSFLANELIKLGNKVEACPIVGQGSDYIKKGIPIIGKIELFNTAGLGYNSIKGRINDLFNGQIIYFLKKLVLIFFRKKKYDYFIVVGDIVPIFFSWLARKKCFIYLVAYSSHYEGMLNLPWPCKYFLKSKNIKKIYSRDLLTSIDLTQQLRREVLFLGNPFMDVFSDKNKSRDNSFNIALLPGSRSPELIHNFMIMIDVLEKLSEYKYFEKVKFNFALTTEFKLQQLKEILYDKNWKLFEHKSDSNLIIFIYKYITVEFKWNSFTKVLEECDLVISMAGTAAEQATGLGKPVVQIEGKGPQFTKSFAEAQRRLLGKFIFCSTHFKTKSQQIKLTIDLILRVMYLIALNKNFLSACKRNGETRIGNIGATKKIVADILNTK